MSDAIRVGIYGAAGYTGQDLVELLLLHPNAQLVFATSGTYAGDPVPGTDLRYIPADQARLEDVDVVFLALPHKTSAAVAARAVAADVRVIDLSADLRMDSAEAYEQWYQTPHPHPELLPVPYGLPEIHREAILQGKKLIAVPGCYPTATLLGLYPLLQIGGIDPAAPLIVDAKSGVSGAGREPKASTHFVEVYGNLKPYSPGRSHRHVGEIEQQIRKIAGYNCLLIFTPHLVPVDRGLMASIYITLNYNVTTDRVHSLYTNNYGDEPLVEVLPPGQEASLKHVVRTNRCVISVTPIVDRYIQVTSVIDNLRKGAAGQAIQNFNLMFGFSETTALL